MRRTKKSLHVAINFRKIYTFPIKKDSCWVGSTTDYSVGMILGPLHNEIESPWPFHFKHSHWWERRSQSKFSSHYAWGTKGDSACNWMWSLHGFLYGMKWIMFHDHLDYFQKPPNKPHTKPGDHDTPNSHNRWFILFWYVWGPAWIEIHWNKIWLRAWSHMAPHYTWASVTTLHDFGSVLGRPLDAFF